MTWSARITKADGTVDMSPAGHPFYSACQSCKHGQCDFATQDPNWRLIQPCFLPKVASAIGNIMTSVDLGADGHMASGQADLKCNGFEAIESEEVPEVVTGA